MYRKIKEVTGPFGTAKVMQDKELPVEAGQWAVVSRDAIFENRWDGHSKADAMAEATRRVGNQQ